MNRKQISLLLACSMVFTFMPQMTMSAKASTSNNVVFSNDFESSKLPDEVGGILTDKDVSVAKLGKSNKALKIASKFDGTDDWDNNKHEVAFNTVANKDLAKGTKVEYDIYIPTANKNFKGLMKSAGGFVTHDTKADTWDWSSLDCGDIKSSSFKDLGDGYSKVHVSTALNEDVKGVCKLDLQIDAYLCNYKGEIYLDNIKITEPDKNVAPSKDTIIYANDVEDEKLPDEVGGVLKDGDVTTESVGENNKALKFTSKFDGTDDWKNNTHQLSFRTNYSKDISTDAKIEYDIIIPTKNKSFTGQMKGAGGLTTHDVDEDTWGWVNFNIQDIKSSDFVDMGNGYSKVHVAQNVSDEVKGLFKVEIQIVAYECSYKGDVYVDNVKFTEPSKENKTPSTTDKNIYYSDFEANQIPNRVEGVINKSNVSIAKANDSKALKVATKFDGTDDWDNNKHELIFDCKSDDDVKKDAKLEFDLLIPTKNKKYDGLIKVAGGFSTFDGDDWGWVSNTGLDVKSSDFTDLGNGYSLKHVVVNPEDTIKGMQNVDIQFDSYNCTYAGDIYIDNLRFHQDAGNSQTETQGLLWDFNDESKGLDGWKYDSVYAYDGPHDVSYDKDFTGSGSMKIDVEYSPKDSWSEVKVDKWINEGVNLSDYNTIKFNLYYNPANMTQGTFKSQFWATADVNKSADIDLSKSEYLGNGVSKVPVSITFNSKDVKTNILILSVVGSSTDYKGSLYIDDINLTKKDVKDPYVTKTATPTDNPTKVDISNLETPSSVRLSDSDATNSTTSLFAYLKGLGKSKYAIFGHQDPTTYKAGPKDSGNDSDVEDLTGSLPGVCGIDGLCFTGAELQLKPGDKRDLVTASADVCKAEAKKGSIITLSAHMPNFAGVAEKGKKNGKYDYSGYTVNDLHGNVAQRILPGGDLNEVFNGYLDMVADYGHQMEEADVPVLFRPFHECTGNWFWWGTAACDNDTYKSLFAYTVEYLRDVKGVHNFLYVYSPSGGFKDTDEYMSRYPGDAFVDVMAMDQYHNNPKGGPEEDAWFQNLKDCVKAVDGLAKEHGKIPALSETGVATTKGKLYDQDGAMAVSGNRDKDWYSHVAQIISDSDMPYYMVWANFAKDNFYVPYMVDKTKGHEMVDNFINYYNDENSVFANGVGDYKSVKAEKESPYEYAYIQSPASGSRVLKPTTIKAKVKSESTDVKYNVKAGDDVIATLDAKLNSESGLYEAAIDQDLLDKIGGRVGTVEVTVDDNVMASAKYIFNIPEQEIKNDVVDDFENYGDEDSLLQGAWTTNYGGGCSVKPTLVKDEDGNHKMKFNYNINTSVLDEGYAGVLNAKKCDWSKYDALQLYIKPDGKGQKLVVQITCNGEDFEVHLPEFAATTEGKTLTIPFSEFKGKKNGKFDPANITSFGLWCNTIVPKDHKGVWNVESSFEFDNIKAVKQSDMEDEALKNATSAVEKAEASKDKTDIEKAEELVQALKESAEKTALEKRLDALKSGMDNPPTGVQILDSNLKSAILKTLKMAPTASLTKEDMAKVVNLDAKNLGIKSLAGLEYATNLKYLDLTGNEVTDISPLKDLKKLKVLTLSKNPLDDNAVKDVANITSLTSLNLDHTKITNIKAISGLVNLKNLYFSFTDVSDITPIESLVNLRMLYFSFTKVTEANVTPIYSCKNLVALGVAGDGMNNYSTWTLKARLPKIQIVLTEIKEDY